MLLVLDNCEQITDAARPIADLLSSSPRLKILVTSRICLHLSMEHEFAVPPLSVPSLSQDISLDELAGFEAVKLFIERARRSRETFTLNDENAYSVVEICNRLDGLPLAIELAAARVKILPPQAILTKLENRLNLLIGGAIDLPVRQQTMRASLEWSDDLLTEDERRLFRDLSVFAGGFTIEAAEIICGNENAEADKEKNLNKDIETKSFDIFEGVSSLV